MVLHVNLDKKNIFIMYPKLLDILLLDRTTKRNIIWATDDYSSLDEAYSAHYPITSNLISSFRSNIIQNRIRKTKEKQGHRRQGKAEVFTPAWLCNEQNNLIDDAWFGRSDVFNKISFQSWTPTIEKITFPPSKTWQQYVDELRLEFACGEAPYLVSPYDSTTGETIQLKNRVGLLDRKLRVVCENTDNEKEWLKWTERAFQSVYGFEFQGDNLFIARQNLLYTYIDYMDYQLKRQPTEKELLAIARIISWNLWQMDALTLTIPYQTVTEQYKQMSLFEFEPIREQASYCQIKDWRSKEIIDFKQLTEGGISR